MSSELAELLRLVSVSSSYALLIIAYMNLFEAAIFCCGQFTVSVFIIPIFVSL